MNKTFFSAAFFAVSIATQVQAKTIETYFCPAGNSVDSHFVKITDKPLNLTVIAVPNGGNDVNNGKVLLEAAGEKNNKNGSMKFGPVVNQAPYFYIPKNGALSFKFKDRSGKEQLFSFLSCDPV